MNGYLLSWTLVLFWHFAGDGGWTGARHGPVPGNWAKAGHAEGAGDGIMDGLKMGMGLKMGLEIRLGPWPEQGLCMSRAWGWSWDRNWACGTQQGKPLYAHQCNPKFQSHRHDHSQTYVQPHCSNAYASPMPSPISINYH